MLQLVFFTNTPSAIKQRIIVNNSQHAGTAIIGKAKTAERTKNVVLQLVDLCLRRPSSRVLWQGHCGTFQFQIWCCKTHFAVGCSKHVKNIPNVRYGSMGGQELLDSNSQGKKAILGHFKGDDFSPHSGPFAMAALAQRLTYVGWH